MKDFSPLVIRLLSFKNFSLIARVTPHAKKALTYFFNLPHRYVRRLYREIVFLAPLFLLCLLLINLQLPKSFFEKSKEQILITPRNSAAHQLLAIQLLHYNDLPKTKRELAFASAFAPARDQPPIEQQILQVDFLQQAPLKIKQEINSWEALSLNYPHFRDADLKLALLNWKIYRPFETKKYLDKAIAEDPNNEVVMRFKNVLE